MVPVTTAVYWEKIEYAIKLIILWWESQQSTYFAVQRAAIAVVPWMHLEWILGMLSGTLCWNPKRNYFWCAQKFELITWFLRITN